MPRGAGVFRVTLATRLYGGFAALLAVSVLLAGVGYLALGHVAGQIARLETVGGNLNRVAGVATALEVIRRTQAEFMLDGSAASVGAMHANEALASALLAECTTDTLSGARLSTFRVVIAQLAEQITGGARLVELGTTARAARSRLFTGGDALTSAMDRMMRAVRDAGERPVAAAATPAKPAGASGAARARPPTGVDALIAATDRMTQAAHEATGGPIVAAAASAERAILLVRVQNWRFLATSDAKGPDKFHAAAAQARHALDALDGLASAEFGPMITAVRAALDDYARNFDVASAAILAQADLFKTALAPRIGSMQAMLHMAQVSLTADSAAAAAAADAAAGTATLLQAGLALAALVLGTLLAVLVARTILRPLAAMTAAMARLAAGDLAVAIPGSGNADEIGDMARATEVFRQNALAAATLAAEQEAGRVAKERRATTLDTLTRAFEAKAGESVKQVSAAAGSLRGMARAMTATADRATGQSTTVAAAAEQASVNVQTVAAAAEELAASIREISRQVAQSSKSTERALEDARRTDGVVQALAEGAQKIGEVVGLISNIAGQTNLLALNATIEAARAGDAGKGFAVVASEVKSLAAQTAKATEDISQQITQIQSVTKAAVESIRDIGSTIADISSIAVAVAAAVEQQGSATLEIARNVQQAASGTAEVSANIAGISQGANETGVAAGQMLEAAGDLLREAEQLRDDVGGYVSGVKAA